MRSALCSVVLLGVCAPCVWGNVRGDELPGTEVKPPVYLSGAADLDRLRASNPDHYARAQRIIAAADHLCPPGRGEFRYATLNARDLRCARMLLRTSNPPKWQMSFRLDDTRYIATVIVTDDPPRLVHADNP